MDGTGISALSLVGWRGGRSAVSTSALVIMSYVPILYTALVPRSVVRQ